MRRGAGPAALAALCCMGPAIASAQMTFPVPSASPIFAPPTAQQPDLIPTLPSPMSRDFPLRSGIDPAYPAARGGDLAFGAFQRGYFATALDEAMKRLKTSPHDGAAMALIGEIYSQGLAVRPNAAEAAKWDKLASEQGNREGAFAYGMALLTGSGVPKDRKAAAALFDKAAAAGHAGALYNLGVMAIQGDGQAHDFRQAAALFQRAADAGDIDALFAMATLLQSGSGVTKDGERAAQLMKQAADEKHVGAQVEYGIMLFNGHGVDKDEAEAARYFQLAAIQGNPVAENRLARLYAAGRGVNRDLVQAARWHILARAAGIPDPWLDSQLAALTPPERTKVEEIIRKQIGP